MTYPEALITTPDHNSHCEDCGTLGRRCPGDSLGASFAHCPSCGSTDLVDDRSPFEVLIEAHRNWVAVLPVDERSAMRKMDRFDTMRRVAKIAAEADPQHCGDCERKSAVAQHIIRFVQSQVVAL